MERRVLSIVLVGMLLAIGSSVQAVTTVDSSADTQIWEWGNEAATNYGSYDAMEVGDFPEWKGHIYGLIKWDVSGISSSDIVNGVTFQIYQAYYTAPNSTVKVWAIDTHDWAEGAVTWNNWAGTSAGHTLLGDMTVALHGNSTFSSAALTQRVQDWVDGSVANYGLLLTYDAVGTEAMEDPAWPGHYLWYGNFYTKENTAGEIAPQLVVDHIPEPATIALLASGFMLSLVRRKRA